MTYQPPENPWLEAKRAAQLDQQRAYQRGISKKRKQTYDPARVRAWRAVERAVQRGDLVKGPCQVQLEGCASEPVQFHHESYERGQELEGRWACQMCHGKLSGREKARRAAQALPPEMVVRAPGVVVLGPDGGVMRPEQLPRWPRLVVHLIGTKCAGKSHLLEALGVPNRARWDALDFYQRVGAWSPEEGFPFPLQQKHPGQWNRLVSRLPADLRRFLLRRRDRLVFVETSGVNLRVNLFFERAARSRAFPLKVVCLAPPPEHVVVQRAHKRGLDARQALRFREYWISELQGRFEWLEQDQAAEMLKTLREPKERPVLCQI